jgi:hypothetical protein
MLLGSDNNQVGLQGKKEQTNKQQSRYAIRAKIIKTMEVER